jgi:hypothetical protein
MSRTIKNTKYKTSTVSQTKGATVIVRVMGLSRICMFRKRNANEKWQKNTTSDIL